MLSIFKKLFGKTEPKAVAPVVAAPAPTAGPSSMIPTIEVAHLSLAAIVTRFPDDLKPLLLGTPDANATVALPIPTILKQLPTGMVKMSLASLHRQAHGLIKPLPPGDKRSVEIPLVEVFRHVRMELLRRRADQRHVEIPENGFNLFGDSANPYAIAPDDQINEEPLVEPEPVVLDLTSEISQAPIEIPRLLKMDDGLKAHFGNGSGEAHDQEAAEDHHEGNGETEAAAPLPPSRAITPPPELTPSRLVTPISAQAPATPPAALPVAPAKTEPRPTPPSSEATPGSSATLALPLTSLSAAWPEEIRSEIAALDPATHVALPVDDVTARLARGRVAFSWKQIQEWLEPAGDRPSAVAGETMLQLPLKVVAPAFLSSSKKPAAERKSVALDESIPALFSDGRPPTETPAPPQEEAVSAPVEEPAPEPEHFEHAHETDKLPETVGEIFHQPHKENWTPAEIVGGTVKLAGVAGAIVALQEGLVVSASLPEGVKPEVVAAFLPQIFARLNQYAGEMRLGDVDDLLFTTHGAHCQIYRLGYIYFAVLGKAGESLPWHELRLITEELARQTHK
jgi:predicted regulator of Ras-like GTPase activity (Roadblock/LC7/MglB family)